MSANRIPVIADIVSMEDMKLLTEGHTDEELAGEDGNNKSTFPDAWLYSNSIRFESLEIASESNNCNELMPGGFA